MVSHQAEKSNHPQGKRKVHGRTFVKGTSQRHFDLLEHFLPKVKLDVAALPNLSADTLFAEPKDDIYMEIGFGGGEHVAQQARENSNIGYIACEPFQNGVAKLLSDMEENPVENIKVYNDDARNVLDNLPDNSIGKMFLLYPDPWHKSKHNKRRFICDDNLVEISRVMKPGAELFVASDIYDYVSWTLRHMLNHPDFEWLAEKDSDWLNPPKGWVSTRYEAKAKRAGRTSSYLFFKRK